MYEHLLVALDGSPHAERVLEHTEGARGGKGFALRWAFASLLAEDRHDAFVIRFQSGLLG